MIDRPFNIPPSSRNQVFQYVDITHMLTDGINFIHLYKRICDYIAQTCEFPPPASPELCFLAVIRRDSEYYDDEVQLWWSRKTTQQEKDDWDKKVAANNKKALAAKIRKANAKEKLELKEREQLRLLKAKYEN